MNELNDFQKIKAKRLIHIIDQNYGELFGPSISVEELTKKWPGNLGRATIIDTSKLNQDEKIIFVQTVLRLLDKGLQNERNDRVMFFIPSADETLTNIDEKLGNVLNHLASMGIGFVFGAKKFMPQLDDLINARIDVVSENDVAVSIKGDKNYRVFLRPSLSGNPSVK